MPTPPRLEAAPPARGVLRAPAATTSGEHRRILPSATLAPYVAHYWSVRWSLVEPELAETLPHPTLHMLFEQSSTRGDRAELAGVPRARFSRYLNGEGWVFGVKFRPGMFRPLLGRSVSTLSGKVVPLADVFAADATPLASAVFASERLEECCALLESFLGPRVACTEPHVLESALELRGLVERMASDHTLLRAEAAAAWVGLDVRTLQRRFREYVGVTPKWVILRYRLHEAAERLRSQGASSLAALASELGYSDQAHFSRDFVKWIGETPSAFLARESDVR